MKLLLIALTLTLSAQAFADCSVSEKKNFITADKVLCDDEANQVLLEGIKVKKFGEEKSVLLNGNGGYSAMRSADNICEAFGLKSAEAIKVHTIYSYLNTGIELVTDYDAPAKMKLVEKKQTTRIAPVKSIICNR